MGVCPSVSSGFGNNADGVGLLGPLLGAETEIVESSLAFNYVEFGRIKLGIVNLLPCPQEFYGIPVAKPVVEEELPILRAHHVCEADVVLAVHLDHCHGNAIYVNLCHSTYCQLSKDKPISLQGQTNQRGGR